MSFILGRKGYLLIYPKDILKMKNPAHRPNIRSIRCTCMLLLREGLDTSSQWRHRPPQHIAVFLFPSNFTSSSGAFTKEAAKDLRCCPLYCMYLMILRPSGLICICDYVSIH